MAYIGRQLTSGNYLKLDDISSQFNGSTTQFNLTSGGQAFYPGSPFSILVSLAGIIQEPDSSYQINESTITFAIAPQASDDFFCIALGTSLGIGVPGEQTVTGNKLSKPFNYDNGLLYLDDTNDYIGIGTDNPQSKLQVDGKVRVGGATTFTEDLVVTGDARITGILTIGTASITFDGNTNKIQIGTGITLTESGDAQYTGVVTATSLNVGTGITLSGTQINVGSATTIHTTGFQIGSSLLHSSGLDLGSNGNIISHNINSTGIITAASFSGDGSALTGIDATALKDSGGNVKVQANESGVFITGVATATSFSGDGSALTGVDADLLDGQQGSYYLNTSTTFGGDVSGTYNSIVIADDSHNHTISNVDGLQTALDGKLSTSGKAADSNLLDGYDANSGNAINTIVLRDGSGNFSANNITASKFYPSGSTNSGRIESGSSWGMRVQTNNGYIQLGPANNDYAHIYTDRSSFYFNVTTLYANGNKIWHAGNDGAGSGLDADNLDGYTWTSSGKNIRGTNIYADDWFRNYNAGEGLYNEATGCHFVSDASDEWTVRDSGNSIRIEFQTNGTTLRGSVYADNGPSIGFLNNNNEWGLRYLTNNGYSPNLYFLESGNESWSGNPGNDQGKIEYHSNRFYIASGANSTEIARFRRSGSDVVVIENNGTIRANAGAIGFPAFNSGSTLGYNTWHQASDNWLITVTVGGPYTNDFYMYAGPSTSSYYEIGRYGDDFNSYTKWAPFSFIIRKGSYFYVSTEYGYTFRYWNLYFQ